MPGTFFSCLQDLSRPDEFPGGPGRTTTPENFTSLMDDLEARIFVLPDETWFYPGHGKDSTLGAERPHLGEWRQRGW
jgi:glyoxylase-like metal-dependent hydrolase (beta-lactamase superfamily II)